MTSGCHESICADPTNEAGEPPFGNYFVSTYPPFSQWSAGEVPRALGELSNPLTSGAPFGLYVHIPFCEKRCDYCYYRSFAEKGKLEHTRYVDALLNELALYRRASTLADRRLEYVYFGGGTPSLLDPTTLRRLLDGLQQLYPWHATKEVTFECAPRTTTRQKLDILHDAGVTRVSLGVQSLDDRVLHSSGRIHLRHDVDRAFELVRRVGFPVVNLDLIVGLPGETDASVDRSLTGAVAMAPESITLYQLEIPQNTPLFRSTSSAPSPTGLASWAVKHERLERCFAQLEAEGYTVRSAYAAVRDPTNHRFVYQDVQYRGGDVLGIGLSSFSYVAGTHFQNLAEFDAYLETVGRGEFPVLRAHALDPEERLIREFILHLKLGRADAAYFANKFAVDVFDRFAPSIRRLSGSGWIRVDPDGIRLTRQGLVRVDRLLREFYLPKHQQVRYA